MMPSPASLSLSLCRRNGYIACPVERWIAQAGVRKDAFGIADILAAHPVRREVLLIQATTVDHIAARLTKAKSRPALRAWLAAGGLFQVWGWSQRAGRWPVKIVEVQTQDLADVLVTAPPRRGRRPVQPGLFDELETSA